MDKESSLASASGHSSLASASGHSSVSASGHELRQDVAKLDMLDYLSIWHGLVRQEFEHTNGVHAWDATDVPNLLEALILQGSCAKTALLQYDNEKSDTATLTIALPQDAGLARLFVQGANL